MELKVTKDRVLAAANKSPELKEVLNELFPEAFDKSVKVKTMEVILDGKIAIQDRRIGDYYGKAFYLNGLDFNWEFKSIDGDIEYILIPTKR